MTDILQEAHPTIDVFGAVDDYINDTDWRVKENANAAYSLSGLANNIAGKVMATFLHRRKAKLIITLKNIKQLHILNNKK